MALSSFFHNLKSCPLVRVLVIIDNRVTSMLCLPGGGWDQGRPCSRRNPEDTKWRGETPNPTPGPGPVMTLSRLYPRTWASSHADTPCVSQSMSAVSRCFRDVLILCQWSWYLSTSMCVEVLTYINIITTMLTLIRVVSLCVNFNNDDEPLSWVVTSVVTVNIVIVLLSNRLCQCHCCLVTWWQLHTVSVSLWWQIVMSFVPGHHHWCIDLRVITAAYTWSMVSHLTDTCCQQYCDTGQTESCRP